MYGGFIKANRASETDHYNNFRSIYADLQPVTRVTEIPDRASRNEKNIWILGVPLKIFQGK